jgi:hypothetical protein
MANKAQYKLTITQLRAMKFNNGVEDVTVIKRDGNKVLLRNYLGCMMWETIANLFNTRYYSIVTNGS